MANGQAFEHAVRLIQDNPSLSVGIHIVLVEELPVCATHLVPSLIDKKGRLHKDYGMFFRKMLLKQISLNEVELEIRAQIDRVVNAGVMVSHLDSHQHLHVYSPILKIVLQLAEELWNTENKNTLGLSEDRRYSSENTGISCQPGEEESLENPVPNT
jgi:predicted glycoside hydrolase/deacetylase ChbG (UPF0249 family)